MNDIEKVISKIKQSAKHGSVKIYEPCKPEVIEKLLRESKAIFQTDLPTDCVEFFKMTDGLGTQRGILYNASDFIKQNCRIWLCESTLETTSNGTVIRFNDIERRKNPTYVWLGCNGNMDSYIFDFSSQQFAVTTLGDETEVWNSYLNLTDLLLYMTEENIQ